MKATEAFQKLVIDFNGVFIGECVRFSINADGKFELGCNNDYKEVMCIDVCLETQEMDRELLEKVLEGTECKILRCCRYASHYFYKIEDNDGMLYNLSIHDSIGDCTKYLYTDVNKLSYNPKLDICVSHSPYGEDEVIKNILSRKYRNVLSIEDANNSVESATETFMLKCLGFERIE